MLRVHLSRVSTNVKVGPIPVSTTSADTCPDACGLKGHLKGCYASAGPLALHWKAVSEGKRGMEWNDFLAQIRALPRGILWRHNQAGDLPGENNAIDAGKLAALVKANGARKGFTYTHKPMSDASNLAAVREANAKGFTINASADTVTDADTLASLGLPTVVVLPSDAPRGMKTPEGRTIAICPAQLSDKVQCATCGLCSRADRTAIVGFRAHGPMTKRAEVLTKADIARRSAIKDAVIAAHA